jgi:hypothetical protein
LEEQLVGEAFGNWNVPNYLANKYPIIIGQIREFTLHFLPKPDKLILKILLIEDKILIIFFKL